MDNEPQDRLLYADEVFQIQGAIFEVNAAMGSGFLEAVYQECLAIEFTDREIPFFSLSAIGPDIQRPTTAAGVPARFRLFRAHHRGIESCARVGARTSSAGSELPESDRPSTWPFGQLRWRFQGSHRAFGSLAIGYVSWPASSRFRPRTTRTNTNGRFAAAPTLNAHETLAKTMASMTSPSCSCWFVSFVVQKIDLAAPRRSSSVYRPYRNRPSAVASWVARSAGRILAFQVS